MIYCVIPRELADELYPKMVEYYKDNPNVTVIVEQREGPDRRAGKERPESEQRELSTIMTPIQRAKYLALQEQVRRRLEQLQQQRRAQLLDEGADTGAQPRRRPLRRPLR